MFRHQGKNRTLKHNLQIATVLSFVAGIVNVTGFLAIQQLTTNVTGHFAQFMYDVEKFKENKKLNVFALPTLVEAFTLIIAAFIAKVTEMQYPNTLACLLLFSMGMQNSFVTKISNEIVRTTHLTVFSLIWVLSFPTYFFPIHTHTEKRINPK